MQKKEPDGEGNGESTEQVEVDALLKGEKKRNDELLTRLKYLQADFENYRKRAENESRDAEETALRGLVTSLLSAVDELDLAVKNTVDHGKDQGLVDGLMMVQKKLRSALESAGLEKIECVGMPFDPTLHEAVEKAQGSRGDVDVVAEEIRPGYTFRGRLVRPSMVKVELAVKKRGEQEAKVE